MAREAKQQEIKELNEMFAKAQSAVLTDYRGISAVEMTALRAHMRQRSIKFFVTKNTLARLAAKNTPFEGIGAHLKGTVSIAVSLQDPIAPAKALADYIKTGPKKEPAVLCGFVDGKPLTPAQVQELAQLPPKEVLLARMLSTFQSPATNFVGVFHGLLRKLVGTLEAVRTQKGGGA